MPAHPESKSAVSPTVIFKCLVAAAVLASGGYGVLSSNWILFLVAAPFSIVVTPGYLELLPKGGMRHGTSCDCPEANALCETGFWLERGQKLLLLVPLVLLSVFFGTYAEQGFERACSETVMALALSLVYALAILIGIVVLIRLRS